jgi:hypothetical protein
MSVSRPHTVCSCDEMMNDENDDDVFRKVLKVNKIVDTIHSISFYHKHGKISTLSTY